jgi:ABC-type polysaccharide/polyol phosphate export permease
MLKTLLPIVIMSVCGLLVGWRISGGFVDAVFGYLLMVVFAFAMIWIGVLLGSVIGTPEGVTGVAFVVLFPLTFLASTFVPSESMPAGVQVVAEWNPVTTLADALRVLFDNPNTPVQPGDPWPIQHPIAYTLIWAIGIVLICEPLAIRAYDRSISR